MIGPKKLSTIRAELRRALAATGDDPIQWLEERMTDARENGERGAKKSEVLQSLLRIIKGTRPAKKSSGRRARARK